MPEKVVEAAVNWGDGKAYIFKGDQYLRYSLRSDMDDSLLGDKPDPGYPKPINDKTWPGLNWSHIDAVVNWGNGKAYFFKGGEYIRYDVHADRADPGYPKAINEKTWPGMIWTKGIDAVVNWGNGKAFFFKDGQYIRYDIKSDSADWGFPKPIDEETWPGLVWMNGFDDVVIWGNGKVYFFKGQEYIRFNLYTNAADPGYPRRIDNLSWPGLKW
ncbi:MAG: hemopexin repeat-containing protein [Syntrophales bacterium]|nr:hemopexin repeat-containing protein [Syntrophales bacterium]